MKEDHSTMGAPGPLEFYLQGCSEESSPPIESQLPEAMRRTKWVMTPTLPALMMSSETGRDGCTAVYVLRTTDAHI